MAFGEFRYQGLAVANAEFIIRELERDGRLLRTWKDGHAKLNGYLEDYSNAASGMLAVYQLTGDTKYFEAARRYADTMIVEFWDEENGGFFFTSNDHEEMILRSKDFFDNATPSGNSAAADVLLRLAKYSGDDRYERFAVAVLRAAATQIEQHPNGFGRALAALEFHISPVRELVIAGDESGEMRHAAFKEFRPDMIVSIVPAEGSGWVPLTEGKASVDGKATAYVCENMTCARPVTSVAEMAELLDA